jgi:D-xylose transport system substrate-binding protein
MSKFKPLASVGKGNVAVILPDTATSARYTEFDAPYLTRALKAAGLRSSQFTVKNAQGSAIHRAPEHQRGAHAER